VNLVGNKVFTELSNDMSEFDDVARDWDNKPERLERSVVIADKIVGAISLRPSMTALEFGAGTGILSLLLKNHFSEITMMDSSREMVRMMEEKVVLSADQHLKPLFFDLEKEAYAGQKVDVIFTQMVMHHVNKLDVVLSHFRKMLKNDGHLAIVDLYAEDGSFHGDGFKGHLGFNPDDLANKLQALGFIDINYQNSYVMRKETADGVQKDFPLFLLIAKTN
jgi:2-polyprenyl-3-methyl-5-hydroxy-6-metoxy-1,4-benzoquinol methylase